MKRISFEPLRQWFGFSRRERRSSFFLLVLIIIITCTRFFVPSKHETIEAVNIPVPERSADTIYKRPQEKRVVNYSRPTSGKASIRVLELNTCDSSALEALPGIGPVLAARILKYRNLLGGYVTTDQLKEVYGLSAETFDLIREHVKADAGLVRKVNLNTADYKGIARLRYLEKADIRMILKYRELNGTIRSVDDLVKNKIITPEKAERVRGYVVF